MTILTLFRHSYSIPTRSFTKNAMLMNNQWSVDNVRNEFVSYFQRKHAHINYISSPCVPVNDPTLLFTNAGMNQVFCQLFVVNSLVC